MDSRFIFTPEIRYLIKFKYGTPILYLSKIKYPEFESSSWGGVLTGFNIFWVYPSTSLFTGGGGYFYLNLNNFHEYLIQHSLKSGGTKDDFRWVQVPGTAPYWKVCVIDTT
jgi:hypothetical protein